MNDIETRNLTYDESRNRVFLRMRDDLIDLGPFEDCEEDCPVGLIEELDELRRLVRGAWEQDRAEDATRRAADAMRHSPEDWR